jgi:hypothetical protein
MRYVVSTGLAFGVVLVAGAVLLDRVEGPSPSAPTVAQETAQETTATSSPAGAPVRPLVPRTGSASLEGGGGRLVSLEGDKPESGATPPGAIDQSPSEARIDSLMAVDLMRMSPQQRQLYVQRLMNRLQVHLQSQPSTPPQR